MASITHATYSHTQRSPLCGILYLVAVQLAVTSVLTRMIPWMWPMMGVLSGMMFLFATAFHHLRVTLDASGIEIAFGPTPLFRKRVEYSEIVRAEVSRTTILDGWGIHYSLSGAWVWNLWGFQCVRLQLTRGALCIGTDDPANLALAIQEQIANQTKGIEEK